MIRLARPHLGRLEAYRVLEVLGSGQLAVGSEVEAFERAYARACGVHHGVATANGTAALHVALSACGIGPGDRVVTTPFSFIATANAIRHCGATPVFADIDPDTYALDPAAVERVLEADQDAGSDTGDAGPGADADGDGDGDGDIAGILAVHLYGLPAAMDRLAAIAAEHDLVLVEDAAQAHGATFDGEPVGSLGDAAAFSFYPTKNMTTGEGGMVVTDRDDVAERAAQLVDHGRPTAASGGDRSKHHVVGYNYRMPELAAAIGRIQLDRLDSFTAARRENAQRLTDALADTDLQLPTEPPDRTHVYNQYTVRSENRTQFREDLEAAGVETGVYYPRVIYDQPAYAGFDADCPVAERAAREVVSLPVHPDLDEAAIDRIATAITAREIYA